MRIRLFVVHPFYRILLWLAIALLPATTARTETVLQAEIVPGYPDRPRFVFSTDLSSDVDDAAAFGFLFEALQRGRGLLAACVIDSPVPAAAPAARAILDAWGLQTVPLGAYQGDSGDTRDGPFARRVADAFGQENRTRKDFESDVQVLRQVYSDAPDRSIVFIAVGFLNSLEGLMRSGPDEITPLDGLALFERKTAFVVSVGANFTGNPQGETRWNWRHAPQAAEFVINHMSRPFYWLPANELDQIGFPEEHPRSGTPHALTGPEGLGWDAARNPIQAAFVFTRQQQPGLLADGLRRKAFDPAAVRFATDADSELFAFHHRDVLVEIREGQVHLDPTREGPFHILELRIPTANNQARDYLDAILARLEPPKRK